MTNDLWGELPSVENIKTPHAILLEQANLLAGKTQGLLLGTVGRGQNGQNFHSTLFINAPALNNYSYAVCTIQHELTLYPVIFYSNGSPNQPPTQCSNEGQLVALLGRELTSPQTQRVITGLLIQIRADALSESDRVSVSRAPASPSAEL
jgi:hypothetical protein